LADEQRVGAAFLGERAVEVAPGGAGSGRSRVAKQKQCFHGRVGA
jgi:hypothetical protein